MLEISYSGCVQIILLLVNGTISLVSWQVQEKMNQIVSLLTLLKCNPLCNKIPGFVSEDTDLFLHGFE